MEEFIESFSKIMKSHRGKVRVRDSIPIRGLERPLQETVTVKPGLFWRCNDVENARAIGNLHRVVNRE